MEGNLPDQLPSESLQDQTVDLLETEKLEASSFFRSKPFFWGLLLLLIVFLLSSIYYTTHIFRQQLEKDSGVGINVQKILDSGMLTIGTDATYAPMEYLDESGKLVGYDVDLGSRIAQELGIETEFKNIAWDDLFQALVNGDVDMIIAGVSITEERKVLYDFSEPYLNAGQVIITQKTDTSIKATSDLAGKKIGVQSETTNEEEALRYTLPELVIGYKDFDLATKALVEGKVDAIFSDLTNAKSIISNNYSLKIASEPFTSDYYGIVIRKGEADLKEKVDTILNTLRQRGILTLLKQKWLE